MIPNFYPSYAYGGTVRVCYELSRELTNKGHEVIVFTSDSLDESHRITQKVLEIDKILVYYFRNISNWLAWHRISTNFGVFLKARKEIKNVDVVHMHGFRSIDYISAYYYAQKYGIPYIIEPHGSAPRFSGKKKMKLLFDLIIGNMIIKGAYKLIAGTQMEFEEFKDIGAKEDKIVVIEPGIDVAFSFNLPQPGGFRSKYGINQKYIILFLGRINKIKGIGFLIKSFYELTKIRNDVLLVIIGPEDGYGNELKESIEKLNISNSVLITGPLYRNDKLASYADATLFIQPSKYEVFCGSPFEALLCNIPIIVTKQTGCGDFVEKMAIGYAVEQDNIIELRDTIDRILNDPSEAYERTEFGKQYILNNLAWKQRIKDYEQLYQESERIKDKCIYSP